MPATVVTVQEINPSTGLVPSFAAPDGDNGNSFPNDGATYIEVIKASGSDVTITIASTVEDAPAGTEAADLDITVSAGTTRKIGPFSQKGFNDSQGRVTVFWNTVTGVTWGVFKFARQ